MAACAEFTDKRNVPSAVLHAEAFRILAGGWVEQRTCVGPLCRGRQLSTGVTTGPTVRSRHDTRPGASQSWPGSDGLRLSVRVGPGETPR